MPFIGQDWRSPGEAWVKYDGGWEKKSVVTIQDTVTPQHLDLILFKSEVKAEAAEAEAVIDVKPLNVGEAIATLDLRRHKIRRKNLSECEQDMENHDPSRFEVMLQEHVRRIRGQIDEEQEINHNELQDQESPQKSSSSNIFLRIESSPGQGKSVPYCPITVKSTREIVGFNGLAEALLRLDFLGAVSDIRRFHYVSQLMYLLFAHDKLSQLPGAAQKILFRMLEEMANTVFKSNANEHVFRKLMDELQTTMTIYRVWGSHLGSSQLFKQHLESRRRITEFVEKMQVEYKQDLATPSSPGLVSALPEECIREILLRLSDPSDLDRASKTCETMKSVASEKRVWRELVQTHFTKLQIEYVLQAKPQLKDSKDWKELYASLRRKYGMREEFTEMIMLCRKCAALFWKSLGHPCFILEEEVTNNELPINYQNSNKELLPISPKSFLTFFSV